MTRHSNYTSVSADLISSGERGKCLASRRTIHPLLPILSMTKMQKIFLASHGPKRWDRETSSHSCNSKNIKVISCLHKFSNQKEQEDPSLPPSPFAVTSLLTKWNDLPFCKKKRQEKRQKKGEENRKQKAQVTTNKIELKNEGTRGPGTRRSSPKRRVYPWLEKERSAREG